MSAVTAKVAVLAAVSACLAACATTQQPTMLASVVPKEATLSSPASTIPSKPLAEGPAKSSNATAEAANARAGDGSTPLQWAAYNGDAAEVARLIKAGADV